jgi:hypothetical protein
LRLLPSGHGIFLGFTEVSANFEVAIFKVNDMGRGFGSSQVRHLCRR